MYNLIMKFIWAAIKYYLKYRLLVLFIITISFIGVVGYSLFFLASSQYLKIQNDFARKQIAAYEKTTLENYLLSIKTIIYKNQDKPDSYIIQEIKKLHINFGYHFLVKVGNKIYTIDNNTDKFTLIKKVFVKPKFEIYGFISNKHIEQLSLQSEINLKHFFYNFAIKSLLIGIGIFAFSLAIFYIVLNQFDKKIKQLKSISEEFKNLTNPNITAPCFDDEIGCIINNFLTYSNQAVKIERIKNAIASDENIDSIYKKLREVIRKEYNLFDVNIFITQNNCIKKAYSDKIYCENCKLASSNLNLCNCYKNLLVNSTQVIKSSCSKDYHIVCIPLFEKFYQNKSSVIIQLINQTPIKNLSAIKKLLNDIKEIIGYKLMLSIFKDQSYKDPLTGAHNRLFLNEYLDLLSKQLNSQNLKFAILFIDIDDFKSLNDTYGHKMGDAFLSEIVRIINLNLRSDDVCVRYGGEEFVVILKNISRQVSKNVALRIKKNVEMFNIDEIKRTVSIGIAYWPDHCKSLADCIKNADNAMYKAKQAGKNTVFEFES